MLVLVARLYVADPVLQGSEQKRLHSLQPVRSALGQPAFQAETAPLVAMLLL